MTTIRLPAASWQQDLPNARCFSARATLRSRDVEGEGAGLPVPYGIDVARRRRSASSIYRIGRIDPETLAVMIDTPFTPAAFALIERCAVIPASRRI